MDASEIKKVMISSLESDSGDDELIGKLKEKGIDYDFSDKFASKVLDSIFTVKSRVSMEIEFARSLNFAFSRIALTGIAAIVLLLISIFLMEGSLSINSLLGINDTYDESIVSLLTGN
ncbi:MAG TPA: hypothetical protein VHO68_13160 [Bacteroidales bacterium]|nr:hypothetical protein [Bacteroidales bacterium]